MISSNLKIFHYFGKSVFIPIRSDKRVKSLFGSKLFKQLPSIIDILEECGCKNGMSKVKEYRFCKRIILLRVSNLVSSNWTSGNNLMRAFT